MSKKESIGFKNYRLKEIVSCVLDTILPRHCIVCDRVLKKDEEKLCIFCLAEMPLTGFWSMKRNEMADKLNLKLSGFTNRYINACALYYYTEGAGYDKISQSLKYFGDIKTGQIVSKMLGDKLSNSEVFKGIDAVVPIPLHRFRRWKRGFNQAEVIAKEVAKSIGAEMLPDALIRKRATVSQTSLSIEEKHINVKGAFKVNLRCDFRKKGYKKILIVDDVFTTGATMSECYKALKQELPDNVDICIATLGYVTH
ncbi:MAG: ComF family protein [Candidatus Cryptobacteroides sp.]